MWQFRRSDLPSARRRWMRRRKFEGEGEPGEEEEEAQDRYDDEEEDPLWDYEEYDEEVDGYGEVGLRSRYGKISLFFAKSIFLTSFPRRKHALEEYTRKKRFYNLEVGCIKGYYCCENPVCRPYCSLCNDPPGGYNNQQQHQDTTGYGGYAGKKTMIFLPYMFFAESIFDAFVSSIFLYVCQQQRYKCLFFW